MARVSTVVGLGLGKAMFVNSSEWKSGEGSGGGGLGGKKRRKEGRGEELNRVVRSPSRDRFSASSLAVTHGRIREKSPASETGLRGKGRGKKVRHARIWVGRARERRARGRGATRRSPQSGRKWRRAGKEQLRYRIESSYDRVVDEEATRRGKLMEVGEKEGSSTRPRRRRRTDFEVERGKADRGGRVGRGDDSRRFLWCCSA